ncbi:MAG: hypothetical protein H6895_13855 [Defluviimonas sp.]|uniref:DUF6502 family protein n=1 Tax=Albidovulum sp. TaxID=1872424 RepID=UPI001D586805|nr:hypothetical protein [Paracoccaceae bacterium]MCC0065148.1 hypothetical protein [Defluviimonas sp.]
MTDTETEEFRRVLLRLTTPLARVMVARGLSFGAASETLKEAMLAAVLAEAPDTTDSRVSLLTGLHRKDVKRLREAPTAPPRRGSLGALARVISHWRHRRGFRDAEGAPAALPRSAPARAPSFDRLIRETRVDLSAGTVWKELVQSGMAEETGDGRLRLLVSSAVDPTTGPGAVEAFEKNLAAHLDTAAANLTRQPGAPARFERALHYSHLGAGSLARLDAEARAGAEALLLALDALANELQEADAGRRDAKGRFSLGVYLNDTHPAGAPPRKEKR